MSLSIYRNLYRSRAIFLSIIFLFLSISLQLRADTCHYAPGDTADSGDDYYSKFWNCSQGKIDKYWDHFNMSKSYWDDGMGYHDVCNIGKPLGRIMLSIYALDISKNVSHNDSILSWAYDYAEGNISTLRVACQSGSLNARNRLSVVTFYWKGIYNDKSVVRRAGIILHESRHTRKMHNGGSNCPAGSSCDYSWQYKGANQYHVLWLWWFGLHARYTTSAMKKDALRDARWRHDNRFVINPGKNI